MRWFRSLGLAILAAVLVSQLPVSELRGQQKAAPPKLPESYPTLTSSASLGFQPGRSTVVIPGTKLQKPLGVWSTAGKASLPAGPRSATGLPVTLDLQGVAPGQHFMRVATTVGITNLRPFCVDPFPEIAETDGNRSKTSPQVVPVPCVISGRADAEAADFFKFPVKAGVPVTIEALGRRLGSPIDPVLILSDRSGREIGGVWADDTPGLQTDARLTVVPKEDGELIAELRDSTYRGGPEYVYRLRIGDFPGATTAFPLVVQRGQKAEITFTGSDANDTKPVNFTAPKEPSVLAVNVNPQRERGSPGWPVPVWLSDDPQLVEAEPNDSREQANPLPVPGGISAKFAKSGDLDHFKIMVKKDQKYVAEIATAEFNSPAEVYLRVLDAKGGKIGESNPTQPVSKVEFTAKEDGELFLACEHQNYVSGPNEVYHLSCTPVVPDFSITLGLDRLDVPEGGVGLLPITGIGKQNGFKSAVTLSIAGDPDLQGTLTLPAEANPQPATPIFVPVKLKKGAKPGPRVITLIAKAEADGKPVVRVGSVSEIVRATLAGIPTSPPQLGTLVAVAITPARPFTMSVSFAKAELPVGGTLKGKVTLTRSKGFAEEVQLTAVGLPANVTFTPKPVAKDATEAEFELKAEGNAPAGPTALVLLGTAKLGKDDVVAAAEPVPFTIVPAKKDEPKKPAQKKKK